MIQEDQLPVFPMPAPGERIYAIGDVHGEGALLKGLLEQIREDSAERGSAIVRLIFLGDIVDRGEDAAALLRLMHETGDDRIVLLKGNHEAVLVECFRGDEQALRFWTRYGGRSTMSGFGVSEQDFEAEDTSRLLTAIQTNIDAGLVDWVEHLPTSYASGDYVFVHAGVRPGVPMERQDDADLMWIREPFLSSKRKFEKIIVHGHTIEVGIPSLGGARIGIDTGGHEHGCLTALGVEQGRQWLIRAERDPEKGLDPESVIAAGATRRSTSAQDDIVRSIRDLLGDIINGRTPFPVPLLLTDDQSDRRASIADRRGGNRLLSPWRVILMTGLICGLGLAWAQMGFHNHRQLFPALNIALPDPDRTALTVSGGRGSSRSPSSDGEHVGHRNERHTALHGRLTVAAPRARSERRSPSKPHLDKAFSGSAPRPVISDTLSGSALENALIEDRLITRRLNEEEITRLKH